MEKTQWHLHEQKPDNDRKLLFGSGCTADDLRSGKSECDSVINLQIDWKGAFFRSKHTKIR